jgi:hypothetical protein
MMGIWHKKARRGGNLPDHGPQGRSPMDTQKSTVFRPERADEDTHPHACTDGLVFLTYVVFDEAVGEEVERLEVVPCRRCASEARA